MHEIELNLSSIIAIRKSRGLTQKDLSELTGINVKRLQKAENENDIRLSDLIKLALFFEVEISKLYKL
jgi:Helix-turn-helix.